MDPQQAAAAAAATSATAAVISAIAAFLNAALVIGLLYFAWKQLEHLRDKEFMDKIRDEKYKFPELTADPEKSMSGLFVRHWLLNHREAIPFERFQRFSPKVKTAIMEVLMAHDRVAHDLDLGLSPKTVVRYQGGEFKKLWEVTEKVIRGIRKEQDGIKMFCVTLQEFVTSPRFKALYDGLYKLHGTADV